MKKTKRESVFSDINDVWNEEKRGRRHVSSLILSRELSWPSPTWNHNHNHNEDHCLAPHQFQFPGTLIFKFPDQFYRSRPPFVITWRLSSRWNWAVSITTVMVVVYSIRSEKNLLPSLGWKLWNWFCMEVVMSTWEIN